MKMTIPLGQRLMKIITEQVGRGRNRKNRYDSYEQLDAVLLLSAAAIYNLADDKGPALAALEKQFVKLLHDRIIEYPHDKTYHS